MRAMKPVLYMLLLALFTGSGCSVTSGHRPLMALELETGVNTLDGCTDCGCRMAGELGPDAARNWWFVFGIAGEDPEQGWRAVSASSHCGRGSFASVQSEFQATVGVPYVILALEISSTGPGGEAVNLEMTLVHRTLAGFDPDGSPTYLKQEQSRSFLDVEGHGISLPLLLADEIERARLGIHDVVVQFRATRIDRGPENRHGSIAVRSDSTRGGAPDNPSPACCSSQRTSTST